MCCRYYSAKYLYPTFRLAANDGGGKASPKHKGPRNLRTRGPILCAEVDLTEMQRTLVQSVAAAAALLQDTGFEGESIGRRLYTVLEVGV